MIASNLVNTAEETFGRHLLSIDDISKSIPKGCVPQLESDGVDCRKNLCYHLMFRTLDGTCNNLERPMLGAAFRPYIRYGIGGGVISGLPSLTYPKVRNYRHFPPRYDDGIGEPVSSMTISRPTARESNRMMLSSSQSVVHDKYNNMMMQWGQFISHDMAKTTLQPSASCISCAAVKSRCMPIPIAPKDPNPTFKQRRCLKVSRSAPICDVSPREQMNENTAYIDGSMIYGSSLKDLHKFRDGRTGMLKMTVDERPSEKSNEITIYSCLLISFAHMFMVVECLLDLIRTLDDFQVVLPFDQSKCPRKEKCSASFTAGDIRANLFLGLSSMHIIFAREHNRVARHLQNLNRSWKGDRIFQEARKIVGAVIQNILYKEYLPKLLGVAHSKVIGRYNGYNRSVDPTIANEFTTSAFRFGHGMIEEFYNRLDFSGGNISHGGFFFAEGVFKSSKILWEGGVDPVLRGFMNSAVKRPHRMTPAITEKMFGNTDLGTLNIQRGRDHAVPSYNTMRTFCGLPKARKFDEFSDMILDRNLRMGLSRSYNTTDDVDFYVGSMLEDPVIGGLVGTTLSCVIGEQFKRVRDGDRFYFENPGVFTPDQRVEIRKSSLSRVICDNGDHFELISQDAFLLPGPQLSPCHHLPEVDLTKWREQ
uniref:peroxidase n=1 Tax=Angiostrongylus cantonensis TaxID=6313 RepID=A0A158P6F3_ANGCA